MHPTYIVRSGDTLTKIANLHRANLEVLRALNPIIQHSDRLTPGWELKLPGKLPRPVLPPPMNAGDFSCTLVEGIPPCTEELIDIVHLTDDSHFHILTHRQSVELKYETQLIQKLMDDLHQNLAKVPEGAQCTFTQTPEAACPCSGCVKREWALKAEEIGVLSLAAEAPATTFIAESRQDNLKEQAAIVQEALVWYRAYVPVLGAGNWGESNWRALQTKKCEELEAELLRLRNEIAALSEPTSKDSSSKASSTRPDSKYGKGLGKDYAKEVTAKPGKSGISVLEIKVFSEPGRRHYIRHSFAGRLEWKVKVSTSVMQGKPFDKQLAKDLIKDIREKISTARKSGPLGGLEGKINLWTSKEDNLLNALHRETAWSSNESDAAPYAYSAEAQALRFAACASAGITNWEPSNGLIDVGFKGSAEYALAQGSVALTAFFPNQGGHLVTMAYRNAEGEVAHRPMGVFRMSGKLELSCFAGAQLSAEAGIKLQIRPPEMPAGSTVLLGRPTIGEGPNGRVGVKCGGFAGAQVGGAVSGTFEWIEPSKYATGAVKPGQANDSSNWASLATIKMEGNVSYGAGATGEFGIDITGNQFTINCAGSVVFGPGAGGGFGTVVDVEQVGKLVL